MATSDFIGRFVLKFIPQLDRDTGEEDAEHLGVFTDRWLAEQTAFKSERNRSGRGVFKIDIFDPFSESSYLFKATLPLSAEEP